VLVDIDECHVVVCDPAIEGPNQRLLISDRCPPVPQTDQVLNERIEVWSNGSSANPITRRGSFDNPTSHVIPLSGVNADQKETPGLCRLVQRDSGVTSLRKGRANEGPRHNHGLGMMALMPRAA
jgi:hypothetical protein